MPAPPAGMDAETVATWLSLAEQVEYAGTYTPAFRSMFELMVVEVHAAKSAHLMPPSAAVRARTAAATALASFGLTAASADKVSSRREDEAKPDEVPVAGALRLVE